MHNLQETAEEAVEHDVLVYSIVQAMQDKSMLVGPASSILECLRQSVPESYEYSVEWVAPNKLKPAIARIEPILLAHGIRYEYKKGSKGRIHIFKK